MVGGGVEVVMRSRWRRVGHVVHGKWLHPAWSGSQSWSATRRNPKSRITYERLDSMHVLETTKRARFNRYPKHRCSTIPFGILSPQKQEIQPPSLQVETLSPDVQLSVSDLLIVPHLLFNKSKSFLVRCRLHCSHGNDRIFGRRLWQVFSVSLH